MAWKNPFKGRRRGQSAQGQSQPNPTPPSLSFIEERMLDTLLKASPQEQAELADLASTKTISELTDMLKQRYASYANYFTEDRVRNVMAAWKARQATRPEQMKPIETSESVTSDKPGKDGNLSNSPTGVDANRINLVLYTPEQLMQQVHVAMSGVQLGMPFAIKFKWIVGEIWSVIGPMCLFLGTAGEVFFFIWNNTADQSAWWVALSVLITVCVLEFTFMVVSYQSDTIRNHMKTKPGGATQEDKKDLLNHKIFWFLLAIGVAIGQISFLVLSMQEKLNNIPFLIAFSVGRSVFTLAGDFYSAFVHREMPSSGDQADQRIKEESDLTSTLLKRKSEQVDLINDGILDLKRKHTEAQIKSESLETELEMKRLENKGRIESKKILDEQARMFTELSGSMIRALFDPKMAEGDRQKLLGTMQGFMGAARMLPQGHTEVEEEKGL